MTTDRHDPAGNLARFFEEEAQRGLVSAYLFGSHAKDRAHKESDVDVGVVLSREFFPTSRDRFEEQVRLSSFLPSHVGARTDVVILNDAPPLFGRRIITEGRRVYCRDPIADRAFVVGVQLLAADLEPYLRRMAKLKLAAIAR